jgi:hypothetical protein
LKFSINDAPINFHKKISQEKKSKSPRKHQKQTSHQNKYQY